MPQGNHKSAPRVVDGRVRKKNNWAKSRDYYDAPQPRMVEIDCKRRSIKKYPVYKPKFIGNQQDKR